MTFGERLKNIIDSNAKFKNQANFAKLLDVSKMAINRYAKDEYPKEIIKTLQGMVKQKINIIYLLTEEGSIMLDNDDRAELEKMKEEMGILRAAVAHFQNDLKQSQHLIKLQEEEIGQLKKDKKTLEIELEQKNEENETLRVQSTRIAADLAQKYDGIKRKK